MLNVILFLICCHLEFLASKKLLVKLVCLVFPLILSVSHRPQSFYETPTTNGTILLLLFRVLLHRRVPFHVLWNAFESGDIVKHLIILQGSWRLTIEFLMKLSSLDSRFVNTSVREIFGKVLWQLPILFLKSIDLFLDVCINLLLG